MSGHSKWAQIKRQKGAADKKKGQLFSKLSRSIALAAKDGGDPGLNYKLRLEIEKARESGMPSAGIERAIKRGTGENTQQQLEEIVYEAYGPGGTALLVETATDNRNRTTGNIRHILSDFDAKLGGQGSVAYLFESRGQILVPREGQDLDSISLKAIDLGAEDVKESDEGLEIYTIPLDVEKTRNALSAEGVRIESYEIVMEALSRIEPDESNRKRILNLIESLEEDEDVISVHTNVNL